MTRDRAFLKAAARDVRPEDFPDVEEEIVAQAAIAYWDKYEQPIGPLLRTDVIDIAKSRKLGTEARLKARKLAESVSGTRMENVAVQALVDRVKALRRSSFYEQAVEKVISAHEQGELTAQTLAELVEKAQTELQDGALVAHDYFSDEEVEKRIAQRAKEDSDLNPMLMIDPLDQKITALGRGRLGVLMAPPGGGKGLGLVHFGLAYVLQGLKVIHLTLEDPLRLVEKRFDCNLVGLPLSKIRVLPRKFRIRFRKARRKMRGRLRIIDGTDGDWTVSRIEKAWEDLKQKGFEADVIVIDYDDDIVCEKTFKGESARRFEFSEVYKRLVKLAAKTHAIIWVAAQTSKGAVGRKVITMKDTAEDFSKMRKAFVALTVGADQENPNVKYLFVAKHREDRSQFGVEIVSDWKRGRFFDRDETLKYIAMKQAQRNTK